MKRVTNRTRLEIVCDILNYCQSPQKKTQIAFHANLSYQMAIYYFEILVHSGLLKVDMPNDGSGDNKRSQQYLKTTPEGREALLALTAAAELLNSIFAESHKIRVVDR